MRPRIGGPWCVVVAVSALVLGMLGGVLAQTQQHLVIELGSGRPDGHQHRAFPLALGELYHLE